MLRISELTGHELKWIQPNGFKMEYELLDGETLAATLRFRSSFGSLASAEDADGCWSFKRVGFWQPVVTVRACNQVTNIATFKNNTWTNGGTLELLDGRKYLASTNFWATKYEIKSEIGQEIVSYQQIGGLIHMSTQVIIHSQSSEHIVEMPWLVPFGWYLTILMYLDSAAATAASSAVM